MTETATSVVETDEPWYVVPLGDRALMIELRKGTDAETNQHGRRIAQVLDRARLPDVTDVVPAIRTVAVHYRGGRALGGLSSFDRMRLAVEALLNGVDRDAAPPSSVVEIPVCYGGDFGPDLEEVAEHCSLPVDEVVALHMRSSHIVCMLGFAPGFPYLGGLDTRLAVPRRATPRTAVPKGSVAIANDQSVIYPLALPGGWNLIGRSPVTLFQPSLEPPCRLRPGDSVRFVSVSPERFRALEDDESTAAGRLASPPTTKVPK